MPSLIQNLVERAEAISNGLENTRTQLEREYAETETRLAELKSEIDRLGKLPHRREFLMAAYLESGKHLCPRCSLHDGVEIEMKGTGGGSTHADYFKCPRCYLEEEAEDS